MKLGINLDHLVKDRGGITVEELVDKAVYCRDLGFTSLDWVTDVNRPDWEDRAKAFREAADARGIVVHQSHAPFNRYRKAPMDEFAVEMDRTIRAAAILGAKYIVIHGDEYRMAPGEVYDSKRVHEWVYDFLVPYVELARSLGIGVALENLFEDDGNDAPRSRHCSTVEELLMLIERFGEGVSCCWDFGHGRLSFGDDGAFESFKVLFPHITCTHVHDNYYGKDLHLPPFLGDLEWEKYIRFMKENGYAGNFTYELGYGHKEGPIMHEFLLFVKKIGDHLLAM